MASKVFLDSNIVVYAMDFRQPAKQARCRELIESLGGETLGVISTQVLCETYSVATRKLHVDPLRAKDVLRKLERLEIVAMTPELVHRGIDCSILNTLSLWDGLILATAASARCEKVWSEDMNDGQVVLGVRIENPLADLGEAGGGDS